MEGTHHEKRSLPACFLPAFWYWRVCPFLCPDGPCAVPAGSFLFGALLLGAGSKTSLSETWGEAGSAKTLTGSTLVVNLFLSDAESQWDSQSRTDAMEMLEEAFAFLTEEAARYGQEIRLTQTDKLASYYLP